MELNEKLYNLRKLRGLTLEQVGERGLLSSCGARASHCGGFSCGAQVPGVGFSSCPSRALESRLSSHTGLVALQLWVFPDQGSNPCPLHQQADSYPLHPREALSQCFNHLTKKSACWELALRKQLKRRDLELGEGKITFHLTAIFNSLI